MSRLRTPAGRIAGSFVSWALFAFAFLGFFQTTGTVIGLGGYCASGGPYVIATPCPDAVVLFAPLGLFGMLIAVVVGLLLAPTFGAPLYLWAWPIFFVAIGVQFLVGITVGGGIVSSLLVGLLAVVMGFLPWWWMIRSGAQPFFLGTADLRGRPFEYQAELAERRRSVWAPRREDGDQIAPRAADWALSLGIPLLAAGLGGWLGVLAFNAVGATG